MNPWLSFLILSVLGVSSVSSLSCIQCDKNGAWYSDEEHERHMAKCQKGEFTPQPCRNTNHTHCIVSWYRSGDSSDKVVTERRCGGVEDVTGCTLYNSNFNTKKKVRRHLLNKENQKEFRKGNTLYVEVCSESCPGGECLNSVPVSLGWIGSIIAFTVAYLV